MDPSPFILDGGLATELEASGFQLQGDPLWSAKLLHTNPQAIKDVHYSFCYTKSKMNNPLEDRREPLVAGSVGPYGAFLHDGSEYTGAYEDKMTLEELKDWHRPQIQCLVKAGADLVAMETIPGLKEAEALVEVLKEFPETKAWLSFSCKDIQNISSGRRFSEAVQVACRSKQLVAVGVNCCPAPLVKPLLESAKSHKKADLSWVVYPNSGERWDPNTGWITEKQKSFAKLSLSWKEQGASWIGGCCRVGPADITALKQQLHV